MSQASSPDPVDRLKELADRRDSEVITDDELQAQKRETLAEPEVVKVDR